MAVAVDAVPERSVPFNFALRCKEAVAFLCNEDSSQYVIFKKGIFIKAIRAHIKACVPGAY
jgi:hypothetical protein